ncbi:MAG: 50S ribosomal protein L11 methyltransferase [Chlorobi bacterium]|nr:50S ribosomal protein L11 methyltransferase [Chlorobiota bacterium]
MKQFIRVELRAAEEYHDTIIAFLQESWFLGAEQYGNSIVIWLRNDANHIPIPDWFHERLGSVGLPVEVESFQVTQDADWLDQWRRSLEPIAIDKKFLIVPFDKPDSWDHATHFEKANIIIIEPKMAFGTGHHATTRLCAECLLETVEPGSKWIDVGTGSGLLAIVAAKLGAGHVIGIENDLDAVENACENIQRNKCEHIVEISTHDALLYCYPTCDGIVANLTSPLLVRLAQQFANALSTGGWLVLSGILTQQCDEVVAAYQSVGFDQHSQKISDEWAALTMVRR